MANAGHPPASRAGFPTLLALRPGAVRLLDAAASVWQELPHFGERRATFVESLRKPAVSPHTGQFDPRDRGAGCTRGGREKHSRRRRSSGRAGVVAGRTAFAVRRVAALRPT